MILVDFSGIIFAAAYAVPAETIDDIDIERIRATTLNSILNFKSQFSSNYGKLVICTEGGKTWRKQIYPQYKMNRYNANQTEKEKEYWTYFFQCINTITKEYMEDLNFPLVKVLGLEADDSIALLSKLIDEQHIVITNDKDMKQLISNKVHLYLAIKKELWTTQKDYFLLEHILRGDSGDGIVNVLSDDDTFSTPGKRQKSITKKLLDEVKYFNREQLIERFGDKYLRNEQLISFEKIPKEYSEPLLECLKEQSNKSNPPLKFIQKHRLNLLERLHELNP